MVRFEGKSVVAILQQPLSRCVCALIGLLVGVGPGSARAETSEPQVKAAFLFNFAKYVNWPAEQFSSPEAPVRICVQGAPDFVEELSRVVAGKKVNGRPLTLQPVDSVRASDNCHIAFLSEREQVRLAGWLAALRGLPVLTVSDVPGFADVGGIIGLKLENRKVRFEVNMVAARQANLKLSSQLLKVAVQIIGQLEDTP